MAYNRTIDPVKKKSPAQKLAEASEGMAQHRASEAAVNANMLRLRALRLAHEAANPPEVSKSPSQKAPKARKKAVKKIAEDETMQPSED